MGLERQDEGAAPILDKGAQPGGAFFTQRLWTDDAEPVAPRVVGNQAVVQTERLEKGLAR